MPLRSAHVNCANLRRIIVAAAAAAKQRVGGPGGPADAALGRMRFVRPHAKTSELLVPTPEHDGRSRARPRAESRDGSVVGELRVARIRFRPAARTRDSPEDARLRSGACFLECAGLVAQEATRRMGGHFERHTPTSSRNVQEALPDRQGESGASRARPVAVRRFCTRTAGAGGTRLPAGPRSVVGEWSMARISGDRGARSWRRRSERRRFARRAVACSSRRPLLPGGVQLLGYDKAPDGQLVDFHAAGLRARPIPEPSQWQVHRRRTRRPQLHPARIRLPQARLARKGTKGSSSSTHARRSRATASLGVLRLRRMCLGRALALAMHRYCAEFAPQRATPAEYVGATERSANVCHRPTPCAMDWRTPLLRATRQVRHAARP